MILFPLLLCHLIPFVDVMAEDEEVEVWRLRCFCLDRGGNFEPRNRNLRIEDRHSIIIFLRKLVTSDRGQW